MNKKKENLPVKIDNKKEKFGTKFINTIKKRWLISGTNTLLLIAILIAITILLNTIVSTLDLTPIDCTTSKEYTLTDQSKQRIENIENNVNLYMVGYTEEDSIISLAKQYNKANKNINVEMIDVNKRTDIAEKYSLTNESYAVVVENGEKSKVLLSDDLYTYDENYDTIDLTEEKITSAILNVTSKKIPKVYFLEGYSEYSLDYTGGMQYLSLYLEDEVLTHESLNLLVKKTIPEDCDTLVILTPTQDFDELTTKEITNYINKGGNILWLNSSYAEKKDLPNVNKILALYGINPFDEGYVYETDENRTLLGYQACTVEDIIGNDITKNLTNAVLLNSTKLNIDKDKLEDLNVEYQEIITSPDTSYYRKNVKNTSTSTDGDEKGSFDIGGIFTKEIIEETEETENSDEDDVNEEEGEPLKSELVIFADNNFISDLQLASDIRPMVALGNNKDIVLNSLAYLTDQEVDITIRKDHTSQSDFTPTDGQKSIILKIIFIVPLAIIILGIIVWQIRRRKK